MKRTVVGLVFIVIAMGLVGCTGEQYSESPRTHSMKIDSTRVMKIQDVIELSKSGLSDSLIIGMMDATNSYFRLKTQDVLDLRKAGVSENVISAMMQPPPEPSKNSGTSTTYRYYGYAPYYPYYWYSGYYPYGYYPSVSLRFGPYYHHPRVIHRGRFH